MVDFSPFRRPAVLAACALAAVITVPAAACGSSPSAPVTDATVTPATAPPGTSYELVPDATVTAGLAEVRRLASEVQTTLGTDPAAARATSRKMFDVWFTFEGTVRKTDKDLYLQMEDGLAAIKAGAEQESADKVAKGMADLDAGMKAYLAAHP